MLSLVQIERFSAGAEVGPGRDGVAGDQQVRVIFAAIYIAWFIGLVVLVGLVSGVLSRPRVKAWIERVTGSALLAFGICLAMVTRP